MRNKLGLSSVVAVVLIIMLSVSALSILGIYIKELISSPSLSPKIECLEYNSQEVLKIVSACYNQDNNEIVLGVQRKAGYSIEKVNFVYSDDSNSRTWACSSDTCGGCKIPDEGKSKNYFLSLDNYETNGKIEIGTGNCVIDSIDIYPC